MSKAKPNDYNKHGQRKQNYLEIFDKFRAEGHFKSVGKLKKDCKYRQIRGKVNQATIKEILR